MSESLSQSPDHTTDAVTVTPVSPAGRTPEEIGAALARAVEGREPLIVVLDAARLGPHLPAARRVVEVLARAQEVVAERRGTRGVERLVTVTGSSIELVDAGAVDVGEEVAFPPADLDTAADELARELGGAHGVVMASRATVSGAPVALATWGPAPLNAAACLSLVTTDAALVSGLDSDAGPANGGVDDAESPTAQDGHGTGDALSPTPTPFDGRYDRVRTLLGVRPGTAESVETGLPPALTEPGGENVEERIARATRIALRPFEAVSQWHPARRHLQFQVDPSTVTATVLQIGVRLDAPDDLALGAAIGRLVVALAAEGVSATPIQHEVGPEGASALVAYLGDAVTA